MASFGGFPQTVNYQTVNVSSGGGSENLLINPRGKINQLNESDGVLVAGQYFCDGWKAGDNGAEVYVDGDGFRLIGGSIVQKVPNIIGAGGTLRANMDVINGSPQISINGVGDTVTSNDWAFINVEISGDNSKFTRCILAESVSLPIYQQSADELAPCFRFLRTMLEGNPTYASIRHATSGEYHLTVNFDKMHGVPSASATYYNDVQPTSVRVQKNKVRLLWGAGGLCGVYELVLDARL